MAAPRKTVLVTGASRGIGLAFVEHYQQSGWNVIAAVRNVTTAEKLKALAPYKLVQLDTSDEASILQAASEFEGEPIDLLINNAGIARDDSIETATKASIVEQFVVNAVGPFLVTRALLANLQAAVAQHGAAIVGNLSSVMGSITDNASGGLLGGGGLYGYRTSKSALNMINANLAIDLKKDKITAVVLHPGYVATDMTSRDPSEIQPAESVAGLSKVLAELKEGDAGKFIRFDGVSLPW